ncbi:hypothetical protein INR49_008600, partial [Caranx melampygus]
ANDGDAGAAELTGDSTPVKLDENLTPGRSSTPLDNSAMAKGKRNYRPSPCLFRCKLVRINVDSTGPVINQQNSDTGEHIEAEVNSGYQLPKYSKRLTDFITLTCEKLDQTRDHCFCIIPESVTVSFNKDVEPSPLPCSTKQ